MPQALIPIATTLAGTLFSKLLGGGGKEKEAKEAAAAPAAKALFNPQQIQQATDRYSKEGTAKWNQVLANMGAGGGAGGPDVASQIGSQAQQMGTALGGLTTASGYGDNPMANMDAILKGVEGGINPKYSVFG